MNACSRLILAHQVRFRMHAFEVAADGDRLGEVCAVVEFDERQAGPRDSFASISGVRFLPVARSTCSIGILSPFSATKILSRRGFGAKAKSYIFIMVAI